MIEVKHFFTEMGVFQQCGTARALLQAVLVVGDGNALLGGECRNISPCDLMRLASHCLCFTK